MKKLKKITVLQIILALLAIMVWSTFFSLTARAQLHLNVGVVDVQDRMDGSTLAWDSGYTQFFGRTGVGANIRSTNMAGDNYYTGEALLKYRIGENRYRLDIGAGAGYNFDDRDLHPVATVRNSFRLDEGTWINIDFDNSYRNSRDWNAGGWRFETYLMVGIGLDVTRLGQRKLKKIKRFF